MTKTFTNKSVRDMPQAARVRGDHVVVTSRVGRAVTGSYCVALDDWRAMNRGHPNPAWWKYEHIHALTSDLDDQPGGPDQAVRIRGAQVAAIEAAFAAGQS